MRRGFLNLVAVTDWATLKVLSWRVSNTMGADFCIAALKEGILVRNLCSSYCIMPIECPHSATGKVAPMVSLIGKYQFARKARGVCHVTVTQREGRMYASRWSGRTPM